MSPVMARQAPGSVMVVDDNPANLKLMGDMLGQQGYEVRLFPRGRLALASAAQRPPDLVLLDINMPEMDGYQVCQQFKADSKLASIPIIFLSALRETQDKVKGLACGGVDYISKPFQFEEVQARVDTHLKIHQLQAALQRQNECLEETVAARTRELQDANARLRILDHAKSDFLKLISHEFRTPLNGLIGVGDLLLDGLPDTAENRELIGMFEASRRRILGILDDALLLTQVDVEGEKLSSGPVSLAQVLQDSLHHGEAIARENGVRLEPPRTFTDCSVRGRERLLAVALQALTEAAIRFTVPGGVVRFHQEMEDDAARVTIQSQGNPLPAHVVDRFFDVFALGECSLSGVVLGLRPAVAYRILAWSGGGAAVENLEGAIRFTARFRLFPG